MSILTFTHEVLRSHDFEFFQTEVGSSEALVGTIGTNCGYVRCFLFTAADESVLMLLGYTGQRVPQGAKTACAELVCRINGKLPLSVFRIDDDGEIVIRSSTLIDKAIPADHIAMFISMLRTAADRYLPAFNAIIYGNEDAETAFENVSSR